MPLPRQGRRKLPAAARPWTRNALACGQAAQQQSHVRASRDGHACRDREDRPTDDLAVGESGSIPRRQTLAPKKGSSGKPVGLWVELQPAEVEVDGGLEVLAVAVAAG